MEFEVEITYTNGHKIRYWFEELELTKTSISWKLSPRYEGKVSILKMNFDAIVSVVQVGAQSIK